MQRSAQPRDKHVTANGLKLHYLDWGGADSSALMLLHGITGNAHDWDEVAPQLTSHYRVLALDQRGHGDSDWTRAGYWPQDFAADLQEVVQQLRIAPFDLVGHSLGAWVGMAYAGDHSPGLRHLLLSDFGPEVGRESAVGIRGTVTNRPAGFKTREEAAAWVKASFNPPRPDAMAERRAQYGLRKNWAGRLVWKHDSEISWLTGSAGLRASPYLWGQLAKVQCPVLVMRGQHSAMLTPEIQDRMVATAPKARKALVKDVGHYLYDNPDEMVRVMLEFLGSA